MGLLSLSNIKKAEFSGFKAEKLFQMISSYQKINLGQLNAYKLMFAIKLSMKKRIFFSSSAWFSDLPAINETSL